jgi:GxxExxY protein
MLRVTSPLSEELENLIHKTIGCCSDVHRALGPGLLENIYSRALCIELRESRIPFDTEKRFPVTYRDHLLCHQHVDLVVADEIILEIKSVEHVGAVHRAQILNYLHVSGLHVGLLVNFNVAVLQDGLKRMVL